MSVDHFGISNAAGTVKTAQDLRRLLRAPVTHAVVGSITVKHRIGNPQPNFWHSPDGTFALNSLGLPNPGLEYYVEMLPAMREQAHQSQRFLYVSICGLEPGDWALLTEKCLEAEVDGIEVNLACPNVWIGGERKKITAFDPAAVRVVMDEVFTAFGGSSIGTTNLAIKLSPYCMLPEDERVGLIADMSRLIAEMEIDEVVLANTQPDFTTPMENEKPVISMPTCGRSGPVLLKESVKQVAAFYDLLPNTISITGVGGISEGKDVHEYLAAGASGVQIGTAYYMYGEPAISRIVQEYASLAD